MADAADEARAGDAAPGSDAAVDRGVEALPDDADVHLMLAARDGDATAFAALHARWSAPLLRHLERLVRERSIAEELVQETFLRVHRARDRYEPSARFSTWLFTIATRLGLNELRRPRHARHHRSLDADDGDAAPLELAAAGAGADDVLHARRVAPRVDAALAALPPRQREALLLAAVDGLSYAEVAASLGTTEKSVKALVHRARVALAERLGSPSEEVA